MEADLKILTDFMRDVGMPMAIIAGVLVIVILALVLAIKLTPLAKSMKEYFETHSEATRENTVELKAMRRTLTAVCRYPQSGGTGGADCQAPNVATTTLEVAQLEKRP